MLCKQKINHSPFILPSAPRHRRVLQDRVHVAARAGRMFPVAGGSTRVKLTNDAATTRTTLPEGHRRRSDHRGKKRDSPRGNVTAAATGGRIRHVTEHFREILTGRDAVLFVGLGRHGRGAVLGHIGHGGGLFQVRHRRVGGLFEARLQLRVEVGRKEADAARLGLEDALFQLRHERHGRLARGQVGEGGLPRAGHLFWGWGRGRTIEG